MIRSRDRVEDLIYGRAQDESFQTTHVKLKFQFESFQTTHVKLKFQFLKGAGD